jgi:hypothetical protein
MNDNLNLSEVQSLADVLKRTPSGAEIYRLARSLGLLAPQPAVTAHPYHRDVAGLTPEQLSNEQGYWAGEYGRTCELLGLLNGQERYLSIRAKEVRARERSRLRRDEDQAIKDAAATAGVEQATGKKAPKKTATQLNDEVEESIPVRDIEDQGILIAVLQSSTTASKEAISMYLTTISREISFRVAQMDARIYSK